MSDKPTKVDNFTVGVACDGCGREMTAPVVWCWREHISCCRACVEKAYHDARPELVAKVNPGAELIGAELL